MKNLWMKKRKEVKEEEKTIQFQKKCPRASTVLFRSVLFSRITFSEKFFESPFFVCFILISHQYSIYRDWDWDLNCYSTQRARWLRCADKWGNKIKVKSNKDHITHELLNVFTRMIKNISIFIYGCAGASACMYVYLVFILICFLFCCVERWEKICSTNSCTIEKVLFFLSLKNCLFSRI